MRIWRISNYADLSGIGGTYSASRWNHLGRRIVYCAEHPALAMLELLVHFDLEDLPGTYQLLEIDVPDGLAADPVDLPSNWKDDPAISRDAFETFCDQGETPVMRVPSIIMPHCWNLLINPLHPDHARLSIVSAQTHPLDPRFLT
ncbi:MAG: RES family NAD+ phosphorylase [Hoeflea sp.]|uniref:RES family NAD+ phosphorylase n=1 Tax=Hoeflea sp. TaxID=1940281 RepID=UPI001DCB6365|nr:RES family NAD+ phosphorylase [Hoeflea sp.]MBU4529126.1 RES family NAD+ phosphorylase [Alphaproteobacteria bacterium]MBU4543531.1 RES family NAD+ phosphorylase [Alphaproteobacteria bacterium]MBU4549156.1 RES family NAD+ phosphorylase [Alphaproteobacteria bacterium]MBV1725291.1 RES family NAD+ phosphorylase [Hoeflea sp.]MBV1785252.1 RES family NAD+ phosphorylase [Hoeflea sp.]